MPIYEPAEKILEDAQTQVNSIIRQASQQVLSIRTNNKKLVNQRVADAKMAIVKDLETRSLAAYSKAKINYDKALQDALARKQLELKAAVIALLKTDQHYAKLLNKLLTDLLRANKNARIYVNLDGQLLDKSLLPIIDKSIRHGFKVDFGLKTYDLDVDAIVDDYLKNHPIEV